ncbi:NAD(P)-binding protein [Hymenopellis radicata]|nr:NAD(P)-binding protein [Hymenopellis radicata]
MRSAQMSALERAFRQSESNAFKYRLPILQAIHSQTMTPSISSIRASNKSILSALNAPTAVFVGGTSGIGRGMAEAFAKHTDGAANIIIVGRNESVAQKIIASFPKPSNASFVHEFVKCDATSMKEIGAAAEAIRSKVPKVDYLVLSPGYSALEGRVETEEGIDRKMAVNYYGRWKFVNDLVPLFNKETGAKVLSVLGAGVGAEINVEDLAMKKNYSVSRVGVVTPTYNDLMNEVCFILFPFRVTGSDGTLLQSFAALHPEHSFVQSTPGIVRTNYLNSSPTPIVRWTGPLLIGLAYPWTVSPADSGEYMWHGLLSTKPGSARIGAKGQDIGMSRYFGNAEQRTALWDHTVKTVN